ncbi:amino acid transporter [Macroventuria anomochaeta]|uniref:Amino acid transporter n=1 Tax=Macroventuria anomochaeta TaxID=301207 RepID=A0ACB6SGW8_9PLEO|nr:amino acid transporter [Macroventuria anomochaeta]KAF2633274.1 amino acid transporter [Macroventuria anomochaeta]
MHTVLNAWTASPIQPAITMSSKNDIEEVISPSNSRDDEPAVVRDGNLAYTYVQAGNGSGPSYQEAVGAPVESKSPLGYHVGWMTVIFLNVNQMIGTGIFSTPATILRGTGSIGLALIYWTIGFIMAIAGFSTYLEFASYFPNRSGSEVAYLEQAYPRPKYLMPIAFAVQSVFLSFSSSNAIVLSRYIWQIAGKAPSDWELKGVAIAAYTLAVICVIAHNRYSLWAVNVLGVFKIVTLIFISIVGFVVLGGQVSSVEDPGQNFRNSFEGSSTNGNSLASALVNIVFSYSGYQNAFNVTNEIQNPIKTIKKNGIISIVLVATLYIFCNIAYFAAVPKGVFIKSNEVAAAVFFTKVFGKGAAETVLNVLVLLSAFGNLLAVLIGQSRMIREVGRQGVLPFTSFWVSTKPFGTPLGPYLLKWAVTMITIVAPPAGDAFQFVVSLKTYPEGMFHLALAVGLYLVRRRFKRVGRDRTDFRAWHVLIILFILIQVYILVMPWFPPAGGATSGTVSFWYATYCVVGIGIIVVCGIYYLMWMHVIPKWRKYTIKTEIVPVDDNGATTHRLVKVPLDQLEDWKKNHGEAGNLTQIRSRA